jgi:hypothetical protein
VTRSSRSPSYIACTCIKEPVKERQVGIREPGAWVRRFDLPAGARQYFLLDTGTGYYREIPAVRFWNGRFPS